MKTDNIEDIKKKIDDIYGVTTYWVDDGFGFPLSLPCLLLVSHGKMRLLDR